MLRVAPGRVARVIVCSALTGAVCASIAVADGDPVGDTRADNSGGGINRDLKGTTHGHKGKKLKHGVSVYGKQIANEDINLYINTNKSATPEFVVDTVDDVLAVRRTSNGQVTGPVRLIAVSEVKVRFLFSPSAIGKPAAYGWFVQLESNKGDVYDRAPNSGYNKHRLAD
jgi:hypothetical protein